MPAFPLSTSQSWMIRRWDDRNLQANYFYARVIIVFEHLMDRALEQLEKPEKLDKLEKPENG